MKVIKRLKVEIRRNKKFKDDIDKLISEKKYEEAQILASRFNSKCKFDTKKGCMAAVCYSNERCGSRDSDNYPRYCTSLEGMHKRLKDMGVRS